MLKRLITILLSFCILSSFAQTVEVKQAISGDSLLLPAFTPRPFGIKLPDSIMNSNHFIPVPDYKEIIKYKEIITDKDLTEHPWPATYEQLRQEFMKVKIDDPIADLDLHLPSMKDLAALARTPGIPGQIGLYSGPGPISLLYDQFSKEARSKEIYAGLMKKDKAGERYNKEVVSRITGITDEDEIKKFMDYCALQIKFILESTDYEIYAAIMNCYDEYCKSNQDTPADGK